SKESAYRTASVSGEGAQFRGLKISRLEAEMENVEIVPAGKPPLDRPWDDVRFLKMRTLRIKSLEVPSDSLRRFLEGRIPGLQISELSVSGRFWFKGKYRFIPVEGELSVRVEEARRRLVMEFKRAKIGPVHV